MSNFSESFQTRMLAAIAQESTIIAKAIDWLGGVVSSGDAPGHDMLVALQSFDYLAQQSHAQADLLRLVCRNAAPQDLLAAIASIPLPAMRDRLIAALGGASVPVTARPLTADEDIFWIEA